MCQRHLRGTVLDLWCISLCHETILSLETTTATKRTLNGTKFHHHFELTDHLGMATFFADPYSACQRGSNEHFNGVLRRYLPKGTRFDDLTQTELDDIIEEINNRPLKVLYWATPAETFQQQLQSTQATTRCTSS
jgi:IS30 family transposase